MIEKLGLTSCPFCGGEETLICHTDGVNITHRCHNRADGPTIHVRGQTQHQAVERWNERAQANSAGPMTWQSMDTAPKDGKHCILAVRECAFIYSVQGAYYDGQWDCVHRDNVEHLDWMPNVRLPESLTIDPQ